jgi:hypothetical protein
VIPRHRIKNRNAFGMVGGASPPNARSYGLGRDAGSHTLRIDSYICRVLDRHFLCGVSLSWQ